MAKSRDESLNVTWDREVQIIFCDLCIKEIEDGNGRASFVNKVGWNNITSKFVELTGENYTKVQLKNKWDGLKKDWKLWKDLKRESSGLGWDPKKKTIDASDNWWREKLEVIPNAKKFKIAGIDPDMEEKLDMMFERIVGSGSFSCNQSIAGLASLNTRDKGVSREDFVNDSDDYESEPDLNTTDEGGAFLIQSQLDKLVTVVTEFITGPPPVVSSAYTIPDVVKVLEEIPELKEDWPFYMNSVRIMEKPIVRELFMSVDPAMRLIFLRHYYEHP